jgi:hypothetical protein
MVSPNHLLALARSDFHSGMPFLFSHSNLLPLFIYFSRQEPAGLWLRLNVMAITKW